MANEPVKRAAPGRWSQGWFSLARRIDSPNFGPRPDAAAVDLVIVHSISLPPGQYGGGEIERLFTNTLDWDAHPYFQGIRGMAVSAHFLVARHGALTQFVSCDARAWHAGPSRWQGRENCNDFSIGIELEGMEGGLFEAAQMRCLARLVRAIRRHYPVNAAVGHEHVAPGRKSDPGAGFDWALLRRLAGDDAITFPACSSMGKIRYS